MKALLCSLALCVSLPTFAHQSTASSFTLVEASEDVWLIQINASLTAFEYEVRQHAGEDTYATAEEFEALLDAYLREAITLSTPNGVPVRLQRIRTQLGHESKVLIELDTLPSDWSELLVTTSLFSDIPHHLMRIITRDASGRVAQQSIPAAQDASWAFAKTDNGLVVREAVVAQANAGKTVFWEVLVFAVLSALLVRRQRGTTKGL